MKVKFSNFIIILLVISCNSIQKEKQSKDQSDIISDEQFDYLEQLTKDVVDSSRIMPGQSVTGQFGPNNTA